MLSVFSNFFGYLLNWIYMLVNENYGVAIIVFSLILRLILLPITYKQQSSIKKTSKIQKELETLKVKYKNNPEQLNRETMELYKRENMSPFSGCFSAIIQIILILSVFGLVSQPLTYMKKIDKQIIEDYKTQIKEEYGTISNYSEIEVIQKKSAIDENVSINMQFLGLDLSKVPNQNMSDIKVYIIPILYVVSSILNIKINELMQNKNKKDTKLIEAKDSKKEEISQEDAMKQMNKSMTYFMPVVTVWIAFIAPLGLALYWFVSNVFTMIERILIKKYLDSKEGKNNV